MNVQPHASKNRVILDLSVQEFTLVTYLLEKSKKESQKHDSNAATLDVTMFNELFSFFVNHF